MLTVVAVGWLAFYEPEGVELEDGGRLYLVSADGDDVLIHLSGTCAGCPGASVTRDRMLEPAIRTVAPKAKLRVTTGWRVPAGAESFE